MGGRESLVHGEGAGPVKDHVIKYHPFWCQKCNFYECEPKNPAIPGSGIPVCYAFIACIDKKQPSDRKCSRYEMRPE
jgi:hypothetical protein